MSKYSTPNNKEYIKTALKIIKEFGITITPEIQEKINSQSTEESVDRVKRSLITQHLKQCWGEEE